MKDVKCECRHVNPHGTIFCEACGRVTAENENDTKLLLDMRYEGSARRSQTYNKTIVDKIWNFFSSVTIGVMLIVITLIASAIGTVFPQEMYIPPTIPAEVYYEDQYGFLGKLYYQLNFHNLYSSWWYLILIASIGVSLVICSIDRAVPLYRALKKQRVTRHESFLKRQRVFGVNTIENVDELLQEIKIRLENKRYKVSLENGNILAEKGRFSRWGPYVNHIGLIIFLIGGMLRFVPGMYIDEILWVREGETKIIPGTNEQYYLKNEAFIFEVYDKEKDKDVYKEALSGAGMVAKNYQSNVVLYKRDGEFVPGEEPKLVKLKKEEIRVNHPLKFEKFAVYQSSYKLNEMHQMTFEFQNKKSEQKFGTILVDLYNPASSYKFDNDYSVEVISYFPDFEFDENGEPSTKSKLPNNPAFVFKMITPEKPDGEVSFVAIQQTIEPFGDNENKMVFKNAETKNVSALTVRKDLTLWVIGLGGIVFMIGLIQGAYWNHRRIWFNKINNELWIAAHTNKNWYGLKREIQSVIKETKLEEPQDQLQPEKND